MPRDQYPGTATVDDHDLKANAERYMRETGEKLPATRRLHPPKPLRPLFNIYYARIYIKVRPERVFVWPDGDLTNQPTVHGAHLEEVRSGHSEEPPEEHGAAAAGEPDWDDRLAFLVEHSTGVLSWLGPDGFPIAVRVPFSADPARGSAGAGTSSPRARASTAPTGAGSASQGGSRR